MIEKWILVWLLLNYLAQVIRIIYLISNVRALEKIKLNMNEFDTEEIGGLFMAFLIS